MGAGMIRESDILQRLSQLSQHQLSLADFERWIGSASWNMHKDSEPVARELASQILFLLSQYGDGDLSEAQLLTELDKESNAFGRSQNAVSVKLEYISAGRRAYETRSLVSPSRQLAVV
jgi:hypothetical protein